MLLHYFYMLALEFLDLSHVQFFHIVTYQKNTNPLYSSYLQNSLLFHTMKLVNENQYSLISNFYYCFFFYFIKFIFYCIYKFIFNVTYNYLYVLFHCYFCDSIIVVFITYNCTMSPSRFS